MNVVTQLTQFVGRDVINKNTTDLAVRCSTGSVELSCVAINTSLGDWAGCGHAQEPPRCTKCTIFYGTNNLQSLVIQEETIKTEKDSIQI